MAQNEHINKVVYNGNTLIDLTGDTVNEDNLLQGYTATKADGTLITGRYNPYPTVNVSTPPDKIEYTAGESLDLSGLSVIATLSIGYSKDVTSECVFSPDDGDILTTDVSEVNINYTFSDRTFSLAQSITVTEG